MYWTKVEINSLAELMAVVEGLGRTYHNGLDPVSGLGRTDFLLALQDAAKRGGALGEAAATLLKEHNNEIISRIISIGEFLAELILHCKNGNWDVVKPFIEKLRRVKQSSAPEVAQVAAAVLRRLGMDDRDEG